MPRPVNVNLNGLKKQRCLLKYAYSLKYDTEIIIFIIRNNIGS